MKLVQGFRTLALSVLLFSASSCTSDGSDPAETVEDENRVPDQSSDPIVEGELPTAEAASNEAHRAGEAIDSNSAGDVQALSTEQQLVDQNANGAGQEVASAAPSTAGAEVDAAPAAAPSESPALPEAPVAEAKAETPINVPAKEVAAAEPISTISDVSANEETAQAPKSKKDRKAKKSGSHRSAKSPALSGNEKVYVVQPGDTLGSISTMLYGSPNQWKTLAELNGLANAARIYPGDAIKYTASEATAAFESRYDGLAKASVTVEKGDTLTKIAARVMGQAHFWKLLWRWNEAALSDPNKIEVGQNLQYVSAQDLEAAASGAAAAPAPAH